MTYTTVQQEPVVPRHRTAFTTAPEKLSLTNNQRSTRERSIDLAPSRRPAIRRNTVLGRRTATAERCKVPPRDPEHRARPLIDPSEPLTIVVPELLVESEPLELLAGHIRDEVEVLVVVEDGEARQLGGGRDQQVGHRRSPVVSTVGEQLLDLDGAVLDGWRQILHGHGGQRWPPQTRPQLISSAGAVPDLQPCDGADAHQTAFDPLRPRLSVGGVAETDQGRLSMSQSITPMPRA
jgi:hypothetical protein